MLLLACQLTALWIVGSVDDSNVYQVLVDQPELRDASISSVMGKPFPVVQAQTSLEDLCKLINKDTPAVLVELEDGKSHIVTRYDIISAMA